MSARAVLSVFGREWRVEWRTRETLLGMALFSLLLMVAGALGGVDAWLVDPGAVERGEALQKARLVKPQTFAPAVIWLTYLFAGMLGFLRAVMREREHGAGRGLLLCPVDASWVYLGKLLALASFLLLVELFALLPAVVFFDLRFYTRGWWLPVVMLLAALVFSAVGTLLATMSTGTRSRELVLPLILFPVLLPFYKAAVQVSTWVFTGIGEAQVRDWLFFLAGGAALMVALGMLTYEYLLEE